MLIVLVPGSGAGCFSYHRAPEARGDAGRGAEPASCLDDDAWPRFGTDGLAELMESPDVIVRARVDEASMPDGWSGDERSVRIVRAIHSDRIVDRELTGDGLYRAWERVHPKAVASRVDRWFDQNASFLTGRSWEWERRIAAARAEVDPEWRPLSQGVYGLPSTGEAERWGLDAGLKMAVPLEARPDAPGLVVHVTSLMENKHEHRLTNRLRDFGFAAAYLESDPAIDGPDEFERRVRAIERSARRRELMAEYGRRAHASGRGPVPEHEAYAWASRRAVEELPDLPSGLGVGAGTDADALGRFVAQAADEKIAEHAYAAAALVRASERDHPHLAGRPVVVVGYSAGSFAAPAAAARIRAEHPERPVLLVLVGGGGDLMTVVRGSSLGDRVLPLAPHGAPPPTEEQMSRLHAAYLEHARLDPVRVARAIRGVPTLHLYATADTAVPTAAAEAFNAAHGSVDRLVHRGGHDTLFYFMPQHAGRVRSWLRAHGVIGPGGPGSGAVPDMLAP